MFSSSKCFGDWLLSLSGQLGSWCVLVCGFAFRPRSQQQNLMNLLPVRASGCTFLVAVFDMRCCFWPGLNGTFQLLG